MNMTNQVNRPYRQTARAQQAEATGERIIDSFIAHISARWFDEVRLEDVAMDAKVTVQTLIRRFGSKEGLLDAAFRQMEVQLPRRRASPVGKLPSIVDAIIVEYEKIGGFVLRLLAQEDRYPAIRRVTDGGRRSHRAWVDRMFSPWLDGMDEPHRQTAHDRLVIALDLYVWKLVRRDMERSVPCLRQIMTGMCVAALSPMPEGAARIAAMETGDVEQG